MPIILIESAIIRSYTALEITHAHGYSCLMLKKKDVKSVKSVFLLQHKYGSLNFNVDRFPDLWFCKSCTTHFCDTRQPFCGAWNACGTIRCVFPVLPFADSRVTASRFIATWPSWPVSSTDSYFLYTFLHVRRT